MRSSPALSPLLGADGIDRLREALTTAGYTGHGLKERLGVDVAGAVLRDPRAVQTLDDSDPLRTLIRLFLHMQMVSIADATCAFAPLPVTDAVTAGIIERHDDSIRASVSLHPYRSWWVLADLAAGHRGEVMRSDYVLDVGPVSKILAQATIREPVGTALDLGTGCGVQALHLSTHAERVTATDLSERAVRFTVATAALNGLDLEVLHGDFLAPVIGRRFDLVVSNPPYVVGPGQTTHLYRDSGRPADGFCAELAASAPALLTEGGYLQFLANWAHLHDQDWAERVAAWVAGTGLDAWVVERSIADANQYVEHWLAESGQSADLAARADWLDWFDAQRIEAVGFGLVTLRNAGRADPVVRIERMPQDVDRSLGAEVPGWFERQDWLRDHDLLAARYRTADGLRLDQQATRDPCTGWQLTAQRLTMSNGRGWSEPADQLMIELIGGCDGSKPLRDQLAGLAAQHDLAADEVVAHAAPAVAHLVERGILHASSD